MTAAGTTATLRMLVPNSAAPGSGPGCWLATRNSAVWSKAKLLLEWSPEQIAGWLRFTFPERLAWHVCHETIYQALYTGRSGLSRTLTARLRTGRPLRRRRRRAHERTPRYVIESRLIDARPPVVETRSRCGDWEGDLIVGTASRSAIGTVVDRKSRYLHLVHLPDGRTAADLVVGLRS